MQKRIYRIFFVVLLALSAMCRAEAFSLALDSVAEWGKFPRFCVNTYRWGDKFFNGYDTAYVKGSGYKFNIKLPVECWGDSYRFILPNNTYIRMDSEPTTTAGVYLTYLAVSVGYDVNISKNFGSPDRSRQRFRFGFNCMLFAAELYYMKNDIGTTIKRFGERRYLTPLNVPFNGINNTTWGVDAYYFFNHKKYSEAASFNFSRLQQKSQGSFYSGISIYTQNLDFNFSALSPELKSKLPSDWTDYHYKVNTHNYAIRFGYGYNWVFAPKWVLGVSVSPIVGLRKGFVNSDFEKYSVSFYTRAKLSVVWNSNRWFAGIVGKLDGAMVNEQKTTYVSALFSGQAVIGWRFNIW